MKKSTLLVFLLIMVYAGAATQKKTKVLQSKSIQKILVPPKVTSIGKLHLGDSISIIDKLGYEGIPEIISTDSEYMDKIYNNTKGNKIYELKADTVASYNTVNGSSLDTRVRCFYIPKFKISDEISIDEVKIKFFNNILFSITSTSNTYLEDGLTLKYGNPRKESKEHIKKFTRTYTGETIKKTEQSFYTNWNSESSNITCSSNFMKYYNDSGEENYLHLFELSDNKFDKIIQKREELRQNEIDKRIKKQKINALDGL